MTAETTIDLSCLNESDLALTSASVMSTHPNAVNIYLSQNFMKDDLVIGWADAIKNPEYSISRMNLSDNEIANTGAIALAKAIMSPNSSITSLFIEDNPIGYKGRDALKIAVKQNPNMINCFVTDGPQRRYIIDICKANKYRARELLEGIYNGGLSEVDKKDASARVPAMIAILRKFADKKGLSEDYILESIGKLLKMASKCGIEIPERHKKRYSPNLAIKPARKPAEQPAA